jgi:hypothetical protein
MVRQKIRRAFILADGGGPRVRSKGRTVTCHRTERAAAGKQVVFVAGPGTADLFVPRWLLGVHCQRVTPLVIRRNPANVKI